MKIFFIEASAQYTCQLNQKVNISISQSDLTALQKNALKQGIPYQVLMSSILHKYASGMLYEASL